MKKCDVTVIMPNYNRTSLLRRALASIAQQTVLPREVIVVDDCSSNENIEIIRAIVQEFDQCFNVRLLENEHNMGANHSRNRGILAAEAKFVAFLDSDDVWMPQKLERQLQEIAKAKLKDNRPVLSATARYRVNGQGEILVRQFGGRVLNHQKIRKSNFLGTLSSIVVETWIARHVRGFDEALPACQDWDFFIRVSEYAQFVGVSDPLCVYVDHDEDRITLNNKKRLRAHIFIYKKYIRTGYGKIRKAEFYRNIAEDYQELGNFRKSVLFYAKSVATGYWKNEWIANCATGILSKYYVLRPPPSIKQKRYERYRQIMDSLLSDAQINAELKEHRRIIESLMA